MKQRVSDLQKEGGSEIAKVVPVKQGSHEGERLTKTESDDVREVAFVLGGDVEVLGDDDEHSDDRKNESGDSSAGRERKSVRRRGSSSDGNPSADLWKRRKIQSRSKSEKCDDVRKEYRRGRAQSRGR